MENKETLEETELVPYEQSLALKELGFDKLCFTYFLNSFLQPAFTARDYSYFNEMSEINPNMLNYEYVLAPTFSQAFKFFREKYGLHGDISEESDWEEDNESWSFDIYKYKLGNNDAMISNCETFNIYEEAELACLIKLIEIVKDEK